MREILFRGKTKDGEWVEGFLFKYGCECCIAEDNIRVSDCELSYYCYDVVDPKTISEFTSLTDKNGKKIFEGDIVKGLFSFHMPVNSVVCFRDGAFGLLWYWGGRERFWAFTSICNVEYEVIGNIHDNPDLLKGEQ